MAVLDSKTINVPCPHCGKKFPERLDKLRTYQDLPCPSCRGIVRVDRDAIRRLVSESEKQIADFKRGLSKFGKR